MQQSKAFARMETLLEECQEVQDIQEQVVKKGRLLNITEELVRSSRAIAFIKDMDARIVTVSDPYEAHFGVSLDDITGVQFLQFEEHDRLAMKSGQSKRFREVWYNDFTDTYEMGTVVKEPWAPEGEVQGVYGVILTDGLQIISKEQYRRFLNG